MVRMKHVLLGTGSGLRVEQTRQEQQEATQLLPLYNNVASRLPARVVCGDGAVDDSNRPHGRDNGA